MPNIIDIRMMECQPLNNFLDKYIVRSNDEKLDSFKITVKFDKDLQTAKTKFLDGVLHRNPGGTLISILNSITKPQNIKLDLPTLDNKLNHWD